MSAQRLSWFGGTRAQFLLSQRVYWRDLGFALTAAILPLALAITYPLSQRDKAPIAGMPAGAYLLPGFIAFTLVWIVYNVVNSSATRRGRLIYKRLRGTPLPDSAILTGEAVSGCVTSVAQCLVLGVFGFVAFDALAPSNPLLLVVGIALGALAFALLSIGLSGLLPSGEVSTWIVTPFILLMMLVSGIVFPVSHLPDGVQQVAQFLPSSQVTEVVRTAYLGHDFASHPAVTNPPQVSLLGGFRACMEPLGLLCGWVGVSVGLGQRFFKWDPRRST